VPLRQVQAGAVQGIICERCGVEITRSKVRRDRMGHIELAAPVTHIWYFKGVSVALGLPAGPGAKDLERINNFAAYVVTRIDDERGTRTCPHRKRSRPRSATSRPRVTRRQEALKPSSRPA
jgi:DNA-directed RNA polymerase beta' subunit